MSYIISANSNFRAFILKSRLSLGRYLCNTIVGSFYLSSYSTNSILSNCKFSSSLIDIFFFINSNFWFNLDIRRWALLSYSVNREISWFFNWRSRFCLSHSLTKSVNVLRILTLSLAKSLSRMISSLYSKL